jgi:tRNA modification GTPase
MALGVLLTALALVEVTIDFADEEVPTDISEQVIEIIDKLIGTLIGRSMEAVSLNGCGTDSKLRSSVRRTLEIDAAERNCRARCCDYSSIAGTTRDVIEVRSTLMGCLSRCWTRLVFGRPRTQSKRSEWSGRVNARSRRTCGCGFDPMTSRTTSLLVVTTFVVIGKQDDAVPGGVSGLTGAGVDNLLDRMRSFWRQRMANVGTATPCGIGWRCRSALRRFGRGCLFCERTIRRNSRPRKSARPRGRLTH